MDQKTCAVLCALLMTLFAGCDNDTGNAVPAHSQGPASAATSVAAGQPPLAKIDAVQADALKAGVSAMQPRLIKAVDGFSKVEPLPSSRYFMHPAMDSDASLELNTDGLSSVTLSPYIGDLSSNSDCYKAPEAGVVRFSWALDSGPPNSIVVDRNYSKLIDIDVSKSKRLTLYSNKGNGTILCDWFSVGFLNVKNK